MLLLHDFRIQKHYTFDTNINWDDNLQIFLGDYVESHQFSYSYQVFDAKLLPPNRSIDLLISELLDPTMHELHGTLEGYTFNDITGTSYMLHYYYAEL